MLSDEEIVLKRLKETLDVLKGKNVITRLDFQIRDMVEDCIRVIEEQQKNNENWKKYCDEQENDITLKNNKICDLEFKIEKQQKEIELNKAKIISDSFHKYVGKKFDKEFISKDKLEAILEKYKHTELGDDEKILKFYKELQSLLEKE